MKMIISMLLLCLTSFPIADKSEKLEAQLGSIQQQLLKWNVEHNDFQKWDLDNNGILDDAEKAALNRRKAELAQILKRLENIAKLKGLNLPVGKAVDGLKDSIKNNFEERTNSEEFNIPKSKFGSEMKAWIGALRDNISLLKEDLTPLKADLLVLEIRNSFAQDPVNLFLAELITKNIRGNTRGEISASVFTGLNEMYDDNFWEIKFSTEKSWRSAYKKDKSMIDQLPKVENTVAFFKSKSFEDKTDPNHPDMIVFYQWCSKLTGQLKLYRGDTPQWLNTNATNLADYLKRHFAFAPLLGDVFVKNISGEKLPSVAVYDRIYLNMKEIEKMNLNELALGSDKFKFLPEDTVIINDIKRCELPAENPVMEPDPKKYKP